MSRRRSVAWNLSATIAMICCVLGCAGDPARSSAAPSEDPKSPGAPPVTAPTPESDNGDSPRAAQQRTWFAMHFPEEGVGSPASYFNHPSGLPKPAAFLMYGNVSWWHTDPVGQAKRLRRKTEQVSHFGVKGMLYTPNAACDQFEAKIASGALPPMDVMARRRGTKGQPGFLGELEAQRDAIARLVAEDMVDFIILRPWQEAGTGFSDGCGFTPETYRQTIEWLVEDIYAELPVKAVIVHWNKIAGIAGTIPDLDDDIEVYAGVTKYRPKHLVGAAAGRNFATEAWQKAGVPTWIAEFTVIEDPRPDEQTGWVATGLRDKSVIPEFFDLYLKVRSTGHVGGVTWLNIRLDTEKVQEGRWDSSAVDPEVRAWWINEVTEENGYILGPTSAD